MAASSDSGNKICKFCKKATAIYTCPKCNYEYCSLSCYRDKNHVKCSEDFYKDWVMTHLQNEHTSAELKRKMISVLKDNKEKNEEESTHSMLENIDDAMASLDISSNISNNSLWKQLTESEKLEFIECIKQGSLEHVIPLWVPWWTVKNEPKLIEDLEAPCQEKNLLPSVPVDIPKLSSLTSVHPANCIKYNLINIIYSYACVTRLYNGEHLDLPEEVMECFLFICPTISENQNFGNVEEAIFASVHKIVTEQSEWNMSNSQALDIFNDVVTIIRGPSERDCSKYVLCSLADIKHVAKKGKKYLKAKKEDCIDSMKSVRNVSRKMDYFISWTIEYFKQFDDLISELELVRISVLENKVFNQITQTAKVQRTCKKKLIEEIT